MKELQETLSPTTAAKILGCKTSTLRSWVWKKRVPHVKVGKLVRFRAEDLSAFLDAHRVPVEEVAP